MLSGTYCWLSVPMSLLIVGLLFQIWKDSRFFHLLHCCSLSRILTAPSESRVPQAPFVILRGTFYKHIRGTTMGSPVSVVVANLAMGSVEQRVLETFYSPPRFWKCFVDDTITVIDKYLVQEFRQHLNRLLFLLLR